MPTVRRGLAVAAVNGKIYAIGGLGTVAVQNTVESTIPAPTPGADDIYGNCAVLLGRRCSQREDYAIGGLDANTNALNTVEAYDPSSNSWSTAASMPTARSQLAATDANGVIYAIGGANTGGTPLNATEQYWPPVTIYTFIKN